MLSHKLAKQVKVQKFPVGKRYISQQLLVESPANLTIAIHIKRAPIKEIA